MVIPSLLRRPMASSSSSATPSATTGTMALHRRDPVYSTSTSSATGSGRGLSSSRQDLIHDRPERGQPPPLQVQGRQRQGQQQRVNSTSNSPERDHGGHFDDDDNDVHADPSMWIDIVPEQQQPPQSQPDDASSTALRSAPLVSSSFPRNLGPRLCGPTIKIPIPSLLCDCVTFFFEWTLAALEVWAEVLSAPPFPLETLQKVSIVLLGVERIRDNLDHSALVVLISNNTDASLNATQGSVWMLGNLPQYLVWGVPGIVALLSVSFVLTLQLSWGHQEEAVIATALILLIFLEALLPLFILGCTSMFLFQQVSWETGLVLLALVWLGSTFCAHCIRRMLYQSLGHG